MVQFKLRSGVSLLCIAELSAKPHTMQALPIGSPLIALG